MIGVLMLLIFMLVFMKMYDQLVQLQNTRQAPAQTST
jgi:hypothetical protein